MDGRSLLSRVTVLAALFILPGAAPAEDLVSMSDRVRASVVEILGKVEATGETAYGTGFVFHESGLVVTNAHVVRGVADVMVRTVDGALLASVDVLDVNEGDDLAVMRVVGLDAPALAAAGLELPAIGSRVVAVGHPRGYEFTVSDGIVSAIRSLRPGSPKLLQTTAPISPGSSGGPLLDGEGEVVGVCSLTLEQGQNINFAIPIARVGPLVERALAIESAFGSEGDASDLTPALAASLAAKQRRAGYPERAETLLERALAKYPDDLGLLEEAAELAWDRGRLSVAREIVGRMIEIAPGNAAALQIESALLAEAGECDGAVRAARSALEAGPGAEKAAEAHAVLAECLGLAGELEPALESVERALASEEIAALPDYHVLHAFLLQSLGRAEQSDRAAVEALVVSGWDPMVVAALKERGLPRLVEIVRFDRARTRGGARVTGIVRNRGPLPLTAIVLSAEGRDAEGVLVATGSGRVAPDRLVPGQTGAFTLDLSGSAEKVASVDVRVVDYDEP